MNQTFSLTKKIHESFQIVRIENLKEYNKCNYEYVTSQPVSFDDIPVSWTLTVFPRPYATHEFALPSSTRIYYQLDIHNKDNNLMSKRFFRFQLAINDTKKGNLLRESYILFKPRHCCNYSENSLEVGVSLRYDGFFNFTNESYNKGGDFDAIVRVCAKDVEEYLSIRPVTRGGTSNTCPYPCNGHPKTAFYARNPRGCSWFFTCNVGQAPKEGRCPDAYPAFNYEKQMCDLPENVPCVDDPPVTTCPPFGITKISHPDTCSKYVLCYDGKEQDRLCPIGLHYSEFHRDCVEPSESDCITDLEFCKRKYEQDTENIFPKISNPRDCGTYYMCSQDNWVIHRQCYPGGLFNPSTGYCEEPSEDTCDVDGQLPVLDLPSDVNFDCSNKIDGSSHPHLESCEFWFFCANGRSYLQKCGTDAKYDINQNRCVSKDFEDLSCANVRSKNIIERIGSRIAARNQV